MAQADLLLRQRADREAARGHAGLDTGDQRGVLGIDAAVDAPVEVTRGFHLAAIIRQHVADLADQALGRADREPLHEVDLVGIDVEGDVGPQLEVQPVALRGLGQVRHLGQQVLVGPLGPVGRGAVDEVAPHAVDVLGRLDAVALAEQARETRVGHRDVQAVGVVVADVLPVDLARAQRDATEGAQVFEAVRRDHCFVRRHHLGHRGAFVAQADEHETAPDLEAHRSEPVTGLVETRVTRAVGDARERAIEIVGPGMIGAHQPFRAAAGPVDDARPAVAADVGEGADLPVPAAHDDHAFAKVVERVPVAGGGDVADVANDLPRGREDPFLLDREELGVGIGPGRKAPALERVGVRPGPFLAATCHGATPCYTIV